MSETLNRIKDAASRLAEKLSREEMTPLERMRAAARFEEPDRVPVILQIHEYAARAAGMAVSEICLDPEKHVLSQILAMERYGHDLPCAFADSYNIEAEALGCRLRFFDDRLPEIAERVVKEPADLARLRVPDPHSAGRMPWIFEVNRLFAEHLGGLVSTYAAVSAPFSLACSIRGYENVIADIATDPDFAHRLMEFCTRVTTAYAREQLAGSAMSVSIIDAWAAPPLVNMEIFDEYVLPYTARAIGAVTPPGANWGGIWGAGVVGDWRTLIRRVIAAGSTNVRAFGEDLEKGVPLGELKELCRSHGRPVLATVTASMMARGTPGEIESAVAGLIRAGAAGGGFVLYGAMVPIDTPEENLLRFVEAAKRLGRYPLRV
jgi:uroporphyrinogen decarboxylase